MLVAGPSSSGKTTFSKRLAVQLLANGHHPFPLALDDYFVDRELTPLDEHGDVDFEALHALDVPLFNEHLLSLMSGHTTDAAAVLVRARTPRAGADGDARRATT